VENATLGTGRLHKVHVDFAIYNNVISSGGNHRHARTVSPQAFRIAFSAVTKNCMAFCH